jgi:hypothetical protein
MVDRTSLVVLGSLLMAVGVGIIVLSGPHARRHADYLRSGRRRPRPYKVFPYDSPEHERFLRWSMRMTGAMAMLVGALWVAGIGAR